MKQFEIKNLKYFYSGKTTPALKIDSFCIEKGDFILLTGPSGSGKTSLARVMGGLVHFYGGRISGNVLFSGESIIEKEKREIRKRIGMVFQNPEKQIIMNDVEREIIFGLENLGIEKEVIKKRVEEIFDEFDIQDIKNASTSDLSSGQKQKLAIASIIAMNPEILILDEPTSQLDPEASKQIFTILKMLNREKGITVVLLEHRLKEFINIASRVIFMDNSEIVIDETPDEYVKQIAENYKEYLSSITFKIKAHSLKSASILGNDSVLEIQNLHFSYNRQVELLKGIDLNLKRGEILSITGRNGQGKSTLLKLISGVLKPDSGSISINVRDKKSMNVGFLSQNPNDYLFSDTVEDELRYTLNNLGIEDKGIIDEVLDSLDLIQFRTAYPRDLSTGQRQRVALASMMVASPPILILDEPTRGLDFRLKRMLGNTLGNLKRKMNTSIILVTQDYDFIFEYSDRVNIMENGKLRNYQKEKTYNLIEERILG